MASSLSFSTSYSFSRPDLDLSKWISSLKKTMEDDDEETNDTDVCIFTVPKTLLDTDPDSYIPEQVAFGPFHQLSQQVYDMQKYKLAAARKVQKRRNVKFQVIVEAMMKKDEARIRACYHKFLDMDGHNLAWMMAVDMAFLLEFLQVYYMREEGGGRSMDISSRLASVVDISGKKLSHVAILRDVVKLENQIPLFLIKTMMEDDRTFEKPAAETLRIMLMGLYHELSPFQYQHQSPCVDIDDCDHLLDFLYHMTVPNHKELGIPTDVLHTTIPVTDIAGGSREKKAFANPGHLKQFLDYIWKIIKKAKWPLGKPMKLVTKLPWNMLSRLPIVEHLKEHAGNMVAKLHGEKKEKQEDGITNSNLPVIEEITIPSVTNMAKAGIFFSPVHGTISEICFDEKTSTLYLPVVHLDVNTEVYLRNLVAYEACVASGPLIMARYTELMNGIIDTEEDAQILMDCKIVYNHLRSEKEVADLWNGMSKCVKMTKVPFMDEAIEGVNKRYDRTWRVKLGKFMTKYVFGSWKFLTLLAAVFLLLLSMVQAVCSVYSCARVIRQLPELDQPPQ